MDRPFPRRDSPRSPECRASACARGSAATAFPSPIGPMPGRAATRWRTSSAWSPCAAPPRPACRSRGRSSAPATTRRRRIWPRTSSPRSSSTRRWRWRRSRAPRRCAWSSSTAPCAPCRARRGPARSSRRRCPPSTTRPACWRCSSSSPPPAPRPRPSIRPGAVTRARPRARRCSACPPSPTRARSSRWSASRARGSASPAAHSPSCSARPRSCAAATSATRAGSTRSRCWPRSSAASRGASRSTTGST